MSVFLIFLFVQLQNLLYDFTYAASGIVAHSYAIEWLGYSWDYVEDLGQKTTAGI
jgi:hypothetical protein